MFLRTQSTIFQHWFKQWLAACQATSHFLWVNIKARTRFLPYPPRISRFLAMWSENIQDYEWFPIKGLQKQLRSGLSLPVVNPTNIDLPLALCDEEIGLHMLMLVNLNLTNKLQWNMYRNIVISINEKSFQYVFCKMSSIKFRVQLDASDEYKLH